MISHKNRPLCGLLALAIFSVVPLQSGCSRQSDTPAPRSRGNYRVISHTREAPRSFSDFRERSGRYTIAFDGREPHEVSYHLRHFITRGEGDIVLEVSDETTGITTVFTLNDEASTATIQNSFGSADLVVNADEQVTVNGLTFSTSSEAAQYLDSTETMSGVPDENLAVAHEELNTVVENSDDSSRSAVVATVVVIVWIISSTVLCSRESRKKRGNYSQMTVYCRDWCQQVICF